MADPAAKAAGDARAVRRDRDRLALDAGRSAGRPRRAARPPAAAAAGAADRRCRAARRSPPRAARRCCTRSRTSSSTPSTSRSTPSGALPACPTTTTATGCAWPPRRRCTSRCCASTCSERWATTTATSTPTTACGRWSSAPAATSLARMALVPRTLEARGLDATPPMQAKLAPRRRRARGRDPRHHPARRDRPRGDRQPLVPLAVRARRARPGGALRRCWRSATSAPRLRPPFNLEARRAAGFSEAELDWLDG